MPQGLPAPQFEIVQLFVKQVDAEDNNLLVKQWNILASEVPAIPTYMGSLHNFQIEATIKNRTNQALTVKYRTQTEGMKSATKGGLVESATITIQAGASAQLPIWQLKMWSEDIIQHNWIVDSDGTVYNALVDYWANASYRADDWSFQIHVASTTVPAQDQLTIYAMDAIQLTPIANVQIAGDINGVTDENGNLIVKVNPGPYHIIASHANYKNDEETIQVTANGQKYNLVLVPTLGIGVVINPPPINPPPPQPKPTQGPFDIIIKVTDSNNKPISGANISPDAGTSVLTDTNGNASLKLSQGEHMITISKGNASITDTIIAASENQTINATLPGATGQQPPTGATGQQPPTSQNAVLIIGGVIAALIIVGVLLSS
jgi:hypothetical protein